MDQNSHSNSFLHHLETTFNSQDVERSDDNAIASNGHETSDNTAGVNARHSVGGRMDGDDLDDMPSLEEVSDSGSEGGHGSDNEVEMQEVEHNHGNASSSHNISADSQTSRPTYISLLNGNRRSRVHDDDDGERDRRHPSQRVSSTNSNASSSSSPAPMLSNQSHSHSSVPPTSSTSQPHAARTPNNTQPHVFRTTINLGNGGHPNNPFRLFQHFLPNNNPNNPNSNASNNAGNNTSGMTTSTSETQADNSRTRTQAHPPPITQRLPTPQDGNNVRHPPSLFGGMFSFELGHGGVLIPLPGGGPFSPPPQGGANAVDNQGNAPHQQEQLPPQVADFLARLSAQVANGTLAGLGFGMNTQQEDPDRARKLIDGLEVVPDGLVRRLERVGGSGGGMGEDPTKGGDGGCAICWDRLLDSEGVGFGSPETPQGSDDKPNTSTSTQSKIVSLPCAHVFHADCLIPWFSRPRQTTCPTCRFNIDPDNLTYVSWQHQQRERREAHTAAARAAQSANPSDTPQETNNATEDVHAADPAPNAEVRSDNASGTIRDGLLRQLTSFYSETVTQPPPTHHEREQQEQQEEQPPAQQAQQADNQPHGATNLPAITVTSIPITIPVPIAFPLGSLHARQTSPAGHAVNASAGPSRPTPATSTDETQVAEPERQPRPQSAPDIAGEYARLFARLGRPSHSPVPLDPVSFESSHNLGPRNVQADGPFNGIAPNTFPGWRGHGLPFNVGFPGLGALPPFNARAATNATPAAPANPHPPMPANTNTFHLPGLDLGIPGMRADVVVTMDMIFDPRGPNVQGRRDDHTHAGVPHQHEGVTMEEDFVMMMPDDHEDDSDVQDGVGERSRFGEEMLRMFAGMPRNPSDTEVNANLRNGQQQQQQQEQEQAPPAAAEQLRQLPAFANLTNGVQFVAGSGRSIGEAFAQLLARMSGARAEQNDDSGGTPAPEAATEQEPRPQNTPANGQPLPRTQPQPAGVGPLPFMAGGDFDGDDLYGGFPMFGLRPHRREGPNPAWSLPPAPGPTLRQRIERREREAGLRCFDVSCGLGPSDEDPFSDKVSEVASSMKQLAIREKNVGGAHVCEHRFHSACLVSAERVALRGADAVVEDGRVDVSCPVCRNAGYVTKEEWDEGVVALSS